MDRSYLFYNLQSQWFVAIATLITGPADSAEQPPSHTHTLGKLENPEQKE